MNKHSIKCSVCNRNFRSISTTHLKTHNMTFTEYKEMYPEAPLYSAVTKEIRKNTLENYINKFGLDEGTKRFNEYRRKQAVSNTFEYKKSKHGWSEEQFNEYNKSRASTNENMVKRYGSEIGDKKWKAYCKLQSYVGSSLEYFVDKYGETEGKLKWDQVCKSKAGTLDNYIRRHGEDEGTKKYFKQVEKTRCFYSNLSQELFSAIVDNIDNEHVYFATSAKQKEFSSYNSKMKRIFFYDYVDTVRKKCIEFNGDIFHANPLKYVSTDIPMYFYNNLTAEEIWNLDKIKIQTMRDAGYDVLVVWENEYNDNPKHTIDRCKEFLYGNTVS